MLLSQFTNVTGNRLTCEEIKALIELDADQVVWSCHTSPWTNSSYSYLLLLIWFIFFRRQCRECGRYHASVHLITPPSILSICYGQIFSKLMADFHFKVYNLTHFPAQRINLQNSCEMTKTLLITLHFWHKIDIWNYWLLITEMDFHGHGIYFCILMSLRSSYPPRD